MTGAHLHQRCNIASASESLVLEAYRRWSVVPQAVPCACQPITMCWLGGRTMTSSGSSALARSSAIQVRSVQVEAFVS